MITDKAKYDILWRQWLETLPKGMKSGNEEIKWLEKNFKTLEPGLQEQLMESMLHIILSQGYLHRFALSILEKRANIRHRREIYQLYQRKLMSAETSQDEWYLNDLIDALSYEPTNEFSDAIKHFLLERKYGQRWTRPSGELLATRPDLFVTGWTRFFSERPYAEWRDSGYIQLFLFHPEQIIALKQYMSVKAKSTWEKFKQALEEMLTKSDFCLLEEARKKIKAILA